MAEAIALLGVISAGVQCAQVGVQLLYLGLSLRSKLQGAPDKVKRWLAQIEQLVALAELIKQTDTDRVLSSLPLLPPPSLSSTRLEATRAEAALLDCTSQAHALRDVLKDMVQDVDDGKGQKIWKTILTAKRETRITIALHEIERQKSMLNIWLGQNNMRQLNNLNHNVQDFREGVEKVDRHMFDVEHTFREEFHTLSTVLHNSYRNTTSSLESLRNLGTSSVESLGQQMQQYHGERQSESSVMQSQLYTIMKEVRAIKQEFRSSATVQARVSSTPSLLKEALQEHTESHTRHLDKSRSFRHRKTRGDHSPVAHTCSCHTTSWLGLLNFGVNVQLALTHRNIHADGCPAHKNKKNSFAAIRCYVKGTVLKNLVRLSFEATHGAGGFSMGMLFRTYRRIQKHPLEPFFRDLYKRGPRNSKPRRLLYDDKTQDSLVRLAERELWHAFNSGVASPDDIDERGRTLLHLQIECIIYLYRSEHRICARITKLLISMGTKTDILDNNFCTALQLLLYRYRFTIVTLDQNSINGDILEWTGIRPGKTMDGAEIVSCMRRWPESKEDLGYPYISDILLRRSEVDLKSFIWRGMKPVEETPRRLSPLHLAAAANWPEGVAILLAGGADRYAQDSELCLPIDFATRTNCSESVELLLQGDCTLNFTIARKPGHSFITLPFYILSGIIHGSDSIRNTLVRTLIRLRHLLGDLRPYGDLAQFSDHSEACVDVAHSLFSGGFGDIEQRHKEGMTPLMYACLGGSLQFARFLLSKGADVLTPHRDSGLTAGYFLAGNIYSKSWNVAYSSLYANLLQPAFNVANNVKSSCRCSPEGFTPVTALRRSNNRYKRKKIGFLMSCLQWSASAVEQQARAFALGEVFDRLEMTHTCLSIYQPNKQIPEEDRLEIENEEEEFHKQLQELMQEYDIERAEFSGGPLEFLDFFFERQELHLPSQEKPWWSPRQCNWNDKDLLGPGANYQSIRESFTGEDMFYGHTEEVKEENMLALLFDER